MFSGPSLGLHDMSQNVLELTDASDLAHSTLLRACASQGMWLWEGKEASKALPFKLSRLEYCYSSGDNCSVSVFSSLGQ